jgi:PTH1 family peptidyl-tRNA hydrolase
MVKNMQENKPLLIVGLGNPGASYARTRHNAGFMAVDELAGADAVWKKEKNSLTTKLDNVILAKPQTFMNLSGGAVLALMTFYKIPLENLIVIHDDIDLKLGEIREKTGGGSAGHNGIKSIDAAVGNNYRRIRIGVGRPKQETGDKRQETGIDTSDWVLGKFSEDESVEINKAISSIRANFV